jgi:PmbA protein
MDKRVASEKLSILDDPGIVKGMGSRNFDSEGLSLSSRIIFDKGVLKSYYIDTYYGRKLGLKATSGSTTNLLIECGERDRDQIITSIDRGIMVTGFNGGNANGSTGDFSYGIEGFLVENGRIIMPVAEMNITGNMKTLWSNLAETGNDPYRKSSWLTPTLVFSDIDFSGK